MGAQLGQDLLQGIGVEPVVGVDDLEVGAPCLGEPRVDDLAVAAVVLVDGSVEAWVATLPPEGALEGVVLGGAVVDDEDLDVGGPPPRL